MARILIALLSVALCSGQLFDELEHLDEQERECLGEDRFPCLSGGCVPRDRYCDGVPDCVDGTDEDFCPHLLPDPVQCNRTHHFLCADKKMCIPLKWLCNNSTDCEDGSDEANCTAVPVASVNSKCKGFVCDGDKCISPLWLCDGHYDCKDRTDEDSESTCHHYNHPVDMYDAQCMEMSITGVRQYRCLDGSLCLPTKYMCDGLSDCRDGSDEGAFCKDWHTACSKRNPCKGNKTRCFPERYGASCHCANMLQYNYTTGTCDDIDECALALPLCSHRCQNVHGRFSCKCDAGYTANEFRYLCFADGPEAKLFFTTKTDIRYVTVKTKHEVVVATGLKEAHGVSYDGKYLYWVETAQGHQAIMRAQLEDVQNTTEVLVSLGLEDPGDVSVDWVGGHIYFSDGHRGTISVCRTDGSVCTTLNTNSIQPRFVTLAVRYGQMYWADWHHRPLIMAAGMDGSNPHVLVDNLRSFVRGMAVDVPNGRLYYVDEGIQVFKIDDKKLYSLIEVPYQHPYAIAVFENTVFWSDWTSNTILTTDKINSDLPKHSVSSLDTPVFDMHVYHPVMFERLPNPCEHKTCSHLCLIASNTSAVCACPDGMALKKNTTCEHIDGYRPLYLVVGGGSSFTRVDYNSLGNPESHTTHFDIGRVQAMAYDNTRDTLFVYDGQRKNISLINMTDFSLGIMHPFLFRGLENVVDMDYDYATDSLYILDAGRRFIEVVSLRTLEKALVARFEDQEIPISFCVLPDYGTMLVAVQERENGNAIHIDRMGLDGEDRTHVVMNDLQGPRVILRYDHNMDVVYIADEGNSIIDVIHPEGTGRDNFRELSTTVISLAVTDPYVFWTDRRTRLFWSNVHEATHYIRKIEFSIFSDDHPLHIQATFPPPDKKAPLLSHPCLTNNSCSHICVQTPHAPLSLTHRSRANFSKPLPYKCLCPPSLLNIEGQCKPLARCKDNELYCHKSNVCFLLGKYCDGFKDCADGEDEENCEEKPKEETHGCSKGYKLCNNICVDNNQMCGGLSTTTQRSTTPRPKCSDTEFECTNSSICIERSQMCDGQPDCLNGSDEATALCELFTCQSNEFMCTLGSCILKGFKCDGDYDCADGSDEVDCDNKTCSLGYYQCRDGECIDFSKRCDGQQDCTDNSDEEECEDPLADVEPVPSCPEGEIPCRLNKSVCIPPTARCNRKDDCPGATDEWGCNHVCSEGFMCGQEGYCLPRSAVCNGRDDCGDGSDETPESCQIVNRTSLLFPPIVLPKEECRKGFLCGNGQCLEWRQVCDKEKHCLDGSDENGLCATACENSTCAVSCQPTPSGPQCQCPTGWRAEGNVCVDVDECASDVCAQECHNQPGSFLCTCHHGYARRPDRRSCKATEGDFAVLYTTGNTVWSIAIGGRGSVLYNDPKNPAIADMDFDVRRNKLFVSLTDAGELVEINSTKTDIVISNIGRPTKLAVDWITGNVFFVDSAPSANSIRVCSATKKRCAKLQKLPINTKVTSLVVDPPNGRMFYCATRDASSVVWSASLAGQGLVDLASARNCSGLAVDSFKKLVYVAETDPPRIFSMDFNGKKMRTVLDSKHRLQPPHGLALFEDAVLFLTANNTMLNRCSLFGKTQCDSFIYRVLGAETFVVRHTSAQRGDVTNPCVNSYCPHLCISEDICVCDEGTAPVAGACKLMEKEQLPLFNGWTQEEYRRAQHAVVTAAAALLVACALYLLVFLYYHFVHRPRAARARNYMEVRFQNATEQTPAPSTAVVEVPEASGTAFVNPMEYVRDLWEQVRGQNRPIGTAGLEIDIPYVQQDLSDTESDLDERETKNIIRKKSG